MQNALMVQSPLICQIDLSCHSPFSTELMCSENEKRNAHQSILGCGEPNVLHCSRTLWPSVALYTSPSAVRIWGGSSDRQKLSFLLKYITKNNQQAYSRFFRMACTRYKLLLHSFLSTNPYSDKKSLHLDPFWSDSILYSVVGTHANNQSAFD